MSIMVKNYERIKIVLKSYQILFYIGIKIFNFIHYGIFKIAIIIIIIISKYASKSTIMCVMPVHYEHYAW
jgi:hypothetical protein